MLAVILHSKPVQLFFKMASITQILNDIKDFAESERPLEYLLIAVNEAKADFQNRIFNSESGAKDSKGKGLGAYSNSYAKYRVAKGRQAKVVDLEFTGSLRRDFKVIKDDTLIKIIAPSETELKKIEYLEKNYKTKIFTLDEEEYRRYSEKASRLFIGELINIWNNE